jgi:PAS domain S-box-containing protein
MNLYSCGFRYLSSIPTSAAGLIRPGRCCRLIGILSLLALAAANATQAGNRADTVRLQLHSPHRFQFAGYYAAIDNGYYRESDIEVQLLEVIQESDPVETVASGGAEYGVGGTEVLLHWLNGQPLILLAAIFQHSPMVLVTRENAGIQTPRDLIGRRVTMPGAGRSVALHAMLLKEGVLPDGLAILSGRHSSEAYLDHSIDAWAASDPSQPFYLKENGINVSVMRPSVYGIDFYGDCLFTSRSECDSHPRRALAFRKASIKGWRWALTHRDEMISIIRERYGCPNSTAHLQYEADRSLELIQPDLVDIGHINPWRWKHIAETLVDLGFSGALKPLDGFIFSPLSPADSQRRNSVAVAAGLVTAGVGFVVLLLFIANRRLHREMASRKRTESALCEIDRRYRAIVEDQTELICRYGLDGSLTFVNDAYGRYLNASPDALIGAPFRPGGDNQGLQTLMSRLSALTPDKPAITTEHRIEPADGGFRWYQWIHRAIFDEAGRCVEYQGAGRDITDLMTARKALADSQKQLEEIAAHIPGAIFQLVKTPDGRLRISYISHGSERLFQMPPSFFLETTDHFLPMVHPEDVAIVSAAIDQSADGLTPLTVEFRALLPDRSTNWIQGAAIPSSSGGRIVWNGMLSDISYLKTTEKALFESEMRFRAMVNKAPVMMHSTDEAGKLIRVSDHWLETMGYRREEVIGRKSTSFLTQESQRFVEGVSYPKFLRLGWCKNVPLRFVKKDGQSIDVLLSAIIDRSASNHSFETLAVLVDITDRIQLEAELLKTRKLESIGVLAGGIAHDYNNLLAVIMGNLSLVRATLPMDDDNASALLEIEKATIKARDLTRKLITFSRGGEPIKHPVNLKALVINTVELTISGTNAKHQIDIPDDLPPSLIDSDQIAQAIQSVVTNATEAMPKGGVVKVTASRQHLDVQNAYGLAPGNYITITVEDQGSGISEDHIDKVFDPYFSTKEQGARKGMGLGLAIAHSIVRKHRGQINVRSQKGHGTTVELLLPADTNRLEKPSPAAPSEPALVSQRRIMVMDDEAMIRDLAVRMLERLGYDACSTADGQEAIDVYAKGVETGTKFDAVILDLTVRGGIGGEDAIKTLKAIDPDVKAVVSSGHTDDPIISNYRDFGFCGVIRKPYTMADMESQLRAILES